MLSRIVVRAIAFAAWAVLAPAGFGTALAADGRGGPPPVFVDGRLIDAPAVLEHGHVLVPVRGVFEALGTEVVYTPPRVVVVRKNVRIVAGLVLGQLDAVVENSARRLAIAPARRGDRVYVPLRFVAETAGARVTYSVRPRLVDVRALDLERDGAPSGVAAALAPADRAPPMWALGLVGTTVALLAAECLRRLTEVLRAKRGSAPR